MDGDAVSVGIRALLNFVAGELARPKVLAVHPDDYEAVAAAQREIEDRHEAHTRIKVVASEAVPAGQALFCDPSILEQRVHRSPA
jgi:hypothetical protein